jgi:hypothetical protein
MIIPTISVDLPYEEKDEDLVRAFLASLPRYNNSLTLLNLTLTHTHTLTHDSGSTFVVKYPFSTNGGGKTFASAHKTTVDEVLTTLENTGRIGSGVSRVELATYALVQLCLTNRREYKIVLIDGKGKQSIVSRRRLLMPCFYLAVSHYGQRETQRAGPAFAAGSDALYPIAEEMCRLFKTAIPYAITEGLFRVDIMVRDSGEVVLNEFESLEATYSAPGQDKDVYVINALVKYWYRVLNELV